MVGGKREKILFQRLADLRNLPFKGEVEPWEPQSRGNSRLQTHVLKRILGDWLYLDNELCVEGTWVTLRHPLIAAARLCRWSGLSDQPVSGDIKKYKITPSSLKCPKNQAETYIRGAAAVRCGTTHTPRVLFYFLVTPQREHCHSPLQSANW